MADTFGEGLIVWNGSSLHRLESPGFRHDPAAQEVHIAGSSANFSAGLCGMDVSPRIFPGEARFLYFRPLSSFGLFAASTGALRRSQAGDQLAYLGADHVLSSQATAHAFSSEGALFLGMTRELGVACWNRYRELMPDNFVS